MNEQTLKRNFKKKYSPRSTEHRGDLITYSFQQDIHTGILSHCLRRILVSTF